MTNLEARKEAIYLALAQIPKGQVISYGKLAELAGITNGARQVGKVLSQLPKGSTLPWHRVVNSQGKISVSIHSTSYQEQEKRLRAEKVEVTNGKINLRRFGFPC